MLMMHAFIIIIIVIVVIIDKVTPFSLRPAIHNQHYNHNDNNNRQFHLFSSNKDFELLNAYHLGNWYGIQTGYDPLDDFVEDYMYSYNNYEPNYIDNKVSSIKHSTSLVLGEIRADCEVCFDSERLRTKEIGIYAANNKDKLHKYLHYSTVKGPGVTRNSGMSIEIGMRSLVCDRKIRVLLAYKPITYRDIENNKYQIPAGMGLTDIIITREKLNTRPLKLDDNPDPLWKATNDQLFTAKANQYYDGTRYVYSDTDSDESSKIVGRDTIPSLRSTQPGDGDEYVYQRIFPGGILVEADSTFEYDKSGQVKVTWVPNHDSSEKLLYQCADVEFKALDKYVMEGNNVKILPPTLVKYSTEEFK